MACNPKHTRDLKKLVTMLNREGKKLGYTVHPAIWVDGVPLVTFDKKEKGPCQET